MTACNVVVYYSRLGAPMRAHERITLNAVAKAIAQLKRREFAGIYDGTRRYCGNMYYVPDDTLMADEALGLGIRSESDFFGGVVPRPFVKTKAITHTLVRCTADRPEGWSHTFAKSVRTAVLPGNTVFSVRDARIAATRMLRHGPVRLKKPLAFGGTGQTAINTIGEVDAFLETVSSDELAQYGLVLETDLREVTTLSAGKIIVDNITITYHGTQRLVRDNEGRLVYGGSDLICVRGGWGALDRIPMTPGVRLGVAQARTYDDATIEYPGFMASRRNYDVGQGLDVNGQRRSGVLEASWRSGGASTAELMALAAFAANRDLRIIKVAAVREFGTSCRAPPGAVVHYFGIDPQDGPILRYTVIHP